MAHAWAIWSYNFKGTGGKKQREAKKDSAARDRAVSSSVFLLSFENCPLVPARNSAQRTHQPLSTLGAVCATSTPGESPNVSAYPEVTCSWRTDCTFIPVSMAGKLELFSSTETFLMTVIPSNLEKSKTRDAYFLRVCLLRWHSSLDSLVLSKRWALCYRALVNGSPIWFP